MAAGQREDAAVSLLKDLLSIPTVNGADRETAAAEYLKAFFEAYGIAAGVQTVDERRANVTAFLPGRDASRTMIWNGHLDTVPYGDLHSWHTDPAEPTEKDGKIFCRGASDMKSGLAAMVFALCDVTDREQLPACNVLFLGTCDEEKGGAGARAAIEEVRRRIPDTGRRPFLLVGEPTALRPGTAQKGCLWLKMEVHGRTSHGAYPERGINAVSCGMHLADAISSFVSSYSHPLLGSATAQVTRIEGGVAPNMTPDVCSIVMDIRMVPGLGTEDVIRFAEGQLAEEKRQYPGLTATFEKLNERRAIEIDANHPQVVRLCSALADRERDTAPIGINFFTDASVLDREDKMDICLFGPGDPSLAHQPDEYVEIDRYLEAISVLEAFCTGQ